MLEGRASWSPWPQFKAICAHFHRTTCGEQLEHAENPAHNLRMNSGDYKYVWKAKDWPSWRFDLEALAGPIADVSRAQGLLLGRLAD